jgi:hypothetical protein
MPVAGCRWATGSIRLRADACSDDVLNVAPKALIAYDPR